MQREGIFGCRWRWRGGGGDCPHTHAHAHGRNGAGPESPAPPGHVDFLKSGGRRLVERDVGGGGGRRIAIAGSSRPSRTVHTRRFTTF